MRSILSRAALPLAALSFVSAISSSAAADAQTIRVGGRYVGPKSATVEARGLAVVTSLSRFPVALATSSVDRFAGGETIVRYEQTAGGLPVIGRGASVRLSAEGQPIATVLDLERDLPSTLEATVTPVAAARVATAKSPSRFGVAASARDAHLVVWPTRERGARLAYAVVPRVPAGLPTRPRVIVDAQTGEVLEARDLVQFAMARSYEFNPTKTPNASSFELALTPTGTTLSNPFLEASNCVDKKTVKPVDFFGFNLNVHVCDLVQVATADAQGDFLYEPADAPGSAESKADAFSEVSIYYHTAKAYAFFRTLQGEPDAQVVIDKPLRVIANLQIPPGIGQGDIASAANPDKPLEPFQNAFFSPAGGGLGQLFQQLYGWDAGALWFGQGPQRDYAYDGDVVYHEFGHAVVDASIKLGAWHVDARGAIDAPGAMNEGLADYFSSAITGDPDVGEYASADFGGQASVIRTIKNEDKCPSAIVGEVHYDSTLFSGALWQAREVLAPNDRPKFDAALYKAMRTNPGRPSVGYDDVAKLFLATLGTDLPAGATALEAAMQARGVLPSCERIIDLKDGARLDSAEKRIGFVSPGLQTLGMSKVAPGILQLRTPLTETAASITVTFTTREGGGDPTGMFGGQATPFAPQVLAKFGSAITWKPGEAKPHDADVTAKVEGTSSRTATIEIPEGTTTDAVYLQIVNTGESDGAYDGVSVSVTPRAGADAPPTTDPGTTTETTTDGGCACNAPGRPGTVPAGGILAGLGLLLGASRRARRSRRTEDHG